MWLKLLEKYVNMNRIVSIEVMPDVGKFRVMGRLPASLRADFYLSIPFDTKEEADEEMERIMNVAGEVKTVTGMPPQVSTQGPKEIERKSKKTK